MTSRPSPSRRRPQLAVLLDFVGGPYQTDVRVALERMAEAKDVDLIVAFGHRLYTPNAVELAHNRIFDLITRDHIDGVIVVSSVVANYCSDAQLKALFDRFAPLPRCSIGRVVEGVPSVIISNEQGMHQIVTHVIEAHRCPRVAYIGGPEPSSEARDRLMGYRRALAEHDIPFDERLVAAGDFTRQSGAAAMAEILARARDVRAVVAANDYMALAAVEVLQEHGVDVPSDVIVCGFDDITKAAFARPPLTTVRQPVRTLAGLAFELVMAELAGESAPAVSHVNVDLVRRDSCGCRHSVGRSGSLSPDPRDGEPLDSPALRRQLSDCVILSGAVEINWPERLISALRDELAGEHDRFLPVLSAVIEQAAEEGANLDEFQGVITVLRAQLASQQSPALEDLWHRSRMLVATALLRTNVIETTRFREVFDRLGFIMERFSTAMALPVLSRALAEELPTLRVRDAAVSLYEDPDGERLLPLTMLRSGREIAVSAESFPATELAPKEFFQDVERRTLIALPLAFQAEHLGVVVLDSGANTFSYNGLAMEIGAGLKSLELHRRVVREIAARRQLEQEQLSQEASVAARIQTALAPVDMSIEGLEIGAEMRTATVVGGDYFDVLPTPQGGWLAVGDVAGHGLGAGLIALMLQSQVASLVRGSPEADPAWVVATLNRVLFDNVRNRLQRDEHATLVVFRYERAGRVTFAGSHDDPILLRAGAPRCECISTDGVWVTALPDISRQTRKSELVLGDGDLLVLYTDGITEATNAHREQFGVERLCRAIEALRDRPAQEIVTAVLESVTAWSNARDDDLTLLVARYRAAGQ